MLKKLKEYLKPDKYIYGVFVLYISILFLCSSFVPYKSNKVILTLLKIRNVCYICFIIKIIYDIVKKRYITWNMILIPYISFFVMLFSKNSDMVLLSMVLLALRDIDIRKLIKMILKIFLVIFVFVIILSLLKVIPDVTYNRQDITRQDITRHSLGFDYPTITIGYYLLIVLMYCYVRREKCRYIELIALEIFNIFLFVYTNGRMSFILITAILAIILLYKILHNNQNLRKIFYSKQVQTAIKILCYSLPIILFIIGIGLTYLYGIENQLAIEIDKILNTRLKLNHEAFMKYPVTLFGTSIVWNGWGGYGYTNVPSDYEYNYVDMSYVRIIFDYGVIVTALVLIGYTILLIRYYKEKDYWTILILCFVLIWALVEPHLIRFSKNIFVLLLAPLLEIGKIKIEKMRLQR